MRWLIAFALLLLICGMGYRQVDKDVHQFGMTVDVYEAEVLGQKGTWMRSVKKPYPIMYLKITTSDGQVHRLRNTEF
jgi:hypothetical protein